MMSEKDASALWSAIEVERCTKAGFALRVILSTGALATAVGIILIYSGMSIGGGIAGFGVVTLCVAVPMLPEPWQGHEDVFRRKPLQIETVKVVRNSVEPEIAAELLTLKEQDPEQLLRVAHLFHVLDVDSKKRTAQATQEFAARQEAIIKG